jgi:hypothetical protein
MNKEPSEIYRECVEKREGVDLPQRIHSISRFASWLSSSSELSCSSLQRRPGTAVILNRTGFGAGRLSSILCLQKPDWWRISNQPIWLSYNKQNPQKQVAKANYFKIWILWLEFQRHGLRKMWALGSSILIYRSTNKISRIWTLTAHFFHKFVMKTSKLI